MAGINETITQMAQEGHCAKEIAQATGMNPGAIHTRLHRLGIRLGRGSVCREAAAYSRAHGIEETIIKFNIRRETLHMARSKYKGE